MNFRVIVLPRAIQDIERNAGWWANHHSIEEADHWLRTVHDQLNDLTHFPHSHALSAENHVFNYEIREKLIGLGPNPRFRAIFTVRNNAIFVLAVRAAQEDRLTPDDIEFSSDTP